MDGCMLACACACTRVCTADLEQRARVLWCNAPESYRAARMLQPAPHRPHCARGPRLRLGRRAEAQRPAVRGAVLRHHSSRLLRGILLQQAQHLRWRVRFTAHAGRMHELQLSSLLLFVGLWGSSGVELGGNRSLARTWPRAHCRNCAASRACARTWPVGAPPQSLQRRFLAIIALPPQEPRPEFVVKKKKGTFDWRCSRP